MGRKKATNGETEEMDLGTDEPKQDEPEFIERKLSREQIEARMQEMARLQIEILDLEERRGMVVRKFNVQLKEKKQAMRKMANEVQSKTERIPAQLTIDEVAERKAKRV